VRMEGWRQWRLGREKSKTLSHKNESTWLRPAFSWKAITLRTGRARNLPPPCQIQNPHAVLAMDDQNRARSAEAGKRGSGPTIPAERKISAHQG